MRKEDIQFVSKKIKLPFEKASLLIEEERDKSLVLEQIDVSKQDRKHLSLDTYVRLVLFKITKNTKFRLEDKEYVAKVLAEYIPKVAKHPSTARVLNKPNLTEDEAKCALIYHTLAYEKINDSLLTSKHVSFIENGFWDGGRRELARDLNNWIKILRSAQKDGWFN